MHAQHLPLFLEDEPLVKSTTWVNLFFFAQRPNTNTDSLSGEAAEALVLPVRAPFPENEKLAFLVVEVYQGLTNFS